jgi:hypothetical protein
MIEIAGPTRPYWSLLRYFSRKIGQGKLRSGQVYSTKQLEKRKK